MIPPELMVVLALAGFPPLADEHLPLADCARCKHSQQPDGGHCFMFKDAPGPRCGQFTRIPEVPQS